MISPQIQKIREVCSSVIEAREKATQGEWLPCHHLKSKKHDESCSCGFPGDVWSKDKDAVLFTMGSFHDPIEGQMVPEIEDRSEVRANAQFAVLAANHSSQLAKSLLIAVEALERFRGEEKFYSRIEANDPVFHFPADEALEQITSQLMGEE